MFALSDSEPTALGFVSRVDPTMGDVLEAGFAAGGESTAVGYAGRVFDNFLAGDSGLGSLVRQEMGRDTSNPLPVEELNKKYGLPGLTFDRPITEEAAKLQNDRQKKLLHYSYMTSELPTSVFGLPGPGEGFMKSLAAFGANVAGSMSNPLDFALNFVPWIGEAKAGTALGRGLIAAERLPFVAKFPVALPAVLNNLVSQSIIEMPRAVGDIQEKGAPDWKGIATDIVIGGAVAEGLRQAGLMVAKMSKSSYDAALRKALADAETGRPIDVSANVHQDPNVVRGDVEATLRRDLEAKIRQAPDFEAKVKEQVDGILKDRTVLEKRLELINKSENLSDAQARHLVYEDVFKQYADIYAAAEASVRVAGHVGEVTKTGARLAAKDFVDMVNGLSPESKVPFEEKAARVGLILAEGDKSGNLTDAQTVRLANELGLKYDWRVWGGTIPSQVSALSPTDKLSVVAKVDQKGKLLSYRATDEALRNKIGTDVLAREEMISGLVDQELARRVEAHAKALQARYAEAAAAQKIDAERKLGSPELNTWLAEDKVMQSYMEGAFKENARLQDPAVAKTLDRGAEPKIEDSAAERALASENLKELESYGELTQAEKDFIEAFPEDESEDFVSAIVDAATGCITGKAIGGK